MRQLGQRRHEYSDCYRPMSQVAVAAPRRHVVRARRCALPVHRDEAASTRLSEAANREYQKVRPSATAGEEAPPGLINRPSTIKQMTMKIPTSVAGSAMLELEASVAVASGEEAACELVPPDPFPGAVLGNAAFPELGTSGVTLAGTVVPGATAFCVPAMAAGALSPADCDVEV
jgi:hypothetical protein